MGTLTFADLKAEVKAGLAGRLDTDARLVRALNMSQERIARIKDTTELQSTLLGTFHNTSTDSDAQIAIPDLREIYSIRLTQLGFEDKLSYVTTRKWDRLYPNPARIGRSTPEVYTRWANTLYVLPFPSMSITYEVRITLWPSAFIDDGDHETGTSDLTHKDELIIEGALIYIFRSLGREEEAGKHQAYFNALIAESEIEDTMKPDADISSSPAPGTGIPRDYWADPFVGGSA